MDATNPQQRRVSVLYAEISGRQPLSERVGEAEVAHTFERCFSRMDRAISSFNGRVVKHMGDRLMATFNTPEEATRAACEMQLRVDKLPHVSGVRLAVGIAFHHGLMDETGNDTSGDTVKVAARLIKLVRAGQILTTVPTAADLSESLQKSVLPLGIVNVRLHGQPIPACAIIWQTIVGSSGEGGFSLPQIGHATEAMHTRSTLRLRLMPQGREVILNPGDPVFTLGRDPKCNMVIRNPHASRNHCHIERRGDHFVLTDNSTNGTHVSPDTGFNLLLKGQEIPLHGRGSLSFGLLSAVEHDDEVVTYALLSSEGDVT